MARAKENSGGANRLRPWLAGLAAIREAVVSLPPIPMNLWLGGMAFVIAVQGLRVLVSRRRIRSGFPASSTVRQMVHRTARRIGLRRVPETLMVEGRVSPMIWCGRRSRLILPVDLWSQLDGTGREAIVCHELAHLRRRDHWICCGELVVAALYWWHPLIWWVRRRLREEAELCCDAWVTWLMPRHRRAYAEALLRTKQYVSSEDCAVPAVGIGVTTGRAKRFTRRLTMVMTQSVKPRVSAPGVAMVLMMAAIGWLTSPTQSGLAADRSAKAPDAAVEVSEESNTFEAYVADRKGNGLDLNSRAFHAAGAVSGVYDPIVVIPALGAHGEECSVDERLARLEKRVEELMRRLEGRLDARVPAVPPVPAIPGLPHVPPIPDLPKVPALPDAAKLFVTPWAWSGCETVVRPYVLPEGKLEALSELMARSDVPILVAPKEDRIDVTATEAQHVMFKAFVDMINGSNEREPRVYRLPKGKLDALTRLMVRSDVPILVSPQEDHLKVHGTGVEQAVFTAFVDMIHPSDGCGVAARAHAATRARAGCESREFEHQTKALQREMKRKATEHRKEIRRRDREHRRARGALERAQRHYERRRSDGRGVRSLLERVTEVLGQEQMRDLQERLTAIARDGRIEALLEDAAQFASYIDAGALEENARIFEAHARLLEAKAEALAQEARALEEQAQAVTEQVDVLEEQAERAEERVETLEGRAEELEVEGNELGHDAHARAMQEEGAALTAEAAMLEAEAENLNREADVLADEVMSYEDQAGVSEEKAEALAELAELILQVVRGLEEHVRELSDM